MDYKKEIHLATANKEELDSKVEMEIKEVVQVEKEEAKEIKKNKQSPIKSPRDFKEKYVKFEQDVLKALIKQHLFNGLKQQIKLTYGEQQFLIDAIGTLGNSHFIIEIKMSNSPQVTVAGVLMVAKYVNAYRDHLLGSVKRLRRNVKGILIVPSTTNSPDFVGDVGILKYNQETDEFSNLSEISSWMHH